MACSYYSYLTIMLILITFVFLLFVVIIFRGLELDSSNNLYTPIVAVPPREKGKFGKYPINATVELDNDWDDLNKFAKKAGGRIPTLHEIRHQINSKYKNKESKSSYYGFKKYVHDQTGRL